MKEQVHRGWPKGAPRSPENRANCKKGQRHRKAREILLSPREFEALLAVSKSPQDFVRQATLQKYLDTLDLLNPELQRATFEGLFQTADAEAVS
jgi:hypothetical protein